MVSDDDSNKVSALLASTQQLRTHWSGLIINIMGFTIVANLAIWSFFIQPYITIFNATEYWEHSYLAFASTVSLVLLFLWRLYTRKLDLGVANLYPDLIYFEGELSCPPDYGISGYLKRELGDAGDFLQSNDLTSEQKSKVASRLVKERLIGARGHKIINWITLLMMLVLVWIVFSLGIFELGEANEHGIVRTNFKIICGIFSGFSFIGMVVLMLRWPRKPCEGQVEKFIDDVKTMEANKQ